MKQTSRRVKFYRSHGASTAKLQRKSRPATYADIRNENACERRVTSLHDRPYRGAQNESYRQCCRAVEHASELKYLLNMRERST